MTEFDKVIPPGGVGKVTASLDTSHYKGPIAKSIRLTSDDPKTSSVWLQMKADVVSAIDVAPSDTPVIRTVVGDPKPTELTVSAADGRPFDVLAVQADPLVRVEVRPAPGTPPAKGKPPGGTIVAGGSSRYLVAITPRTDAPIGQTIANVTLTTSLAKAGRVPIRAYVFVQGRVRVMPDQLRVQPGATPPVWHVRLTKPTGGGLEILGVESSDPEFTTAVSTIADGREYDLAITYVGKPQRGPVTSRITVKTNEPGQESITIPLSGRV